MPECFVCGEECEEPRKLREYLPSCKYAAEPDTGPRWYCQWCSPFDAYKNYYAESLDRTYVLYACGNVTVADEAKYDPEDTAGGLNRHERQHAPIRCRCGSPITEVLG